ncbi:MAG: MBL fold metallo-hydrolase [Anaerolineae bacterium]|nr:MBL fold metallo-hydrolase [Anaerolineae bacterium]
MELTWYGSGCFLLTEKGYPSLVMDPYVEEFPGREKVRFSAGIVTSSRILDEPQFAQWPHVPDVKYTVAGPGEYEIDGVFITGVAARRTKSNGKQSPDTVIYAVNIAGVIICHFGESGVVPSQSQLELLGSINVLLLPVGVPGGLTPVMASEVVSMVVPDIVVPMQYAQEGRASDLHSVDPFLKVMGVGTPTTQPVLRLEPRIDHDATQVILLDPSD